MNTSTPKAAAAAGLLLSVCSCMLHAPHVHSQMHHPHLQDLHMLVVCLH